MRLMIKLFQQLISMVIMASIQLNQLKFCHFSRCFSTGFWCQNHYDEESNDVSECVEELNYRHHMDENFESEMKSDENVSSYDINPISTELCDTGNVSFISVLRVTDKVDITKFFLQFLWLSNWYQYCWFDYVKCFCISAFWKVAIHPVIPL